MLRNISQRERENRGENKIQRETIRFFASVVNVQSMFQTLSLQNNTRFNSMANHHAGHVCIDLLCLLFYRNVPKRGQSILYIAYFSCWSILIFCNISIDKYNWKYNSYNCLLQKYNNHKMK